MDLLGPPSLEEQIKEVEREIEMRRKVYPGWVQSRKLGGHRAQQQMAAMEAVLATLKGIAAQ